MASKLLSNEFQKHICLDYECTTIEEAIHKAGDLLVQVGCVKPPYINGMIRREQETSTDIGLGVMIPHGTEDTLNFVLKPGISIVQIPHGVSYHGNTIHLVIGISSREEDSLQELMQITDILLKPEKCHQFLNASSKQEFIDMINQNYVEEGGVVKMKEKTSISQKLQKFGSVLAGMVIPNIGAFIGFGLITAFFLETGWTPNAKLAKLISPILNYLLPILIGHTGGKMFGGDRGEVIGALVTMGAIVAVDGTPMFLAAMILGPVAGVCIKKFDQAVDGKIPSGFEMIVNNFSLGIIGAILCCFAMLVFGPVMETVTTVLTNGVNWIVAHNALPLSAIFVEPAKVLFLNNALDHGIFGPIGYEQVKTLGHSALFLLVPNPGAGLGLLLAYWFFGKGEMKEAAPGMILIHFFGGIHEVYFPYVLANPLTIIGMIAGGIVGTGTLTFLNVGTVATPSPGSIFSVVALSPKNCMFGVLLSVVLSCVVSFLLNAIFVKRMVAKGGDTSLGESVVPKEAMGSSASSNESTAITNDSSLGVAGVDIKNIKKIVVACDAGMGSSAMSAAALKKKVKAANLPIEVINTAISKIPDDADLVITHVELTGTAKAAQPNKQHLSISNYLKAPEYDQLVERFKNEL